MSEYEYDKNKPGQAANTADDPDSGTDSTEKTAAPQNRSSVPDESWENDDWSMRSSSVDEEDDPLIKLARLMEQNERNFEAAAQRPGGGRDGEPGGEPSAPLQQPQSDEMQQGGQDAGAQDSGTQDSGTQDSQMRSLSASQQPEHLQNSPEQNPENPTSQDRGADPTQTARPVARQPGPVTTASGLSARLKSVGIDPRKPEPRQPVNQGYRTPSRQEQVLPASDLSAQSDELLDNPPPLVDLDRPALPRRDSTTTPSQLDDQQFDPFAPGGSSRPLPERDFDVSRIPRAIRPTVSDNHSQMGGLHGQASPDLTVPEPPVTPPIRPELPRSRAQEAAAVQPNPLTAELMRYVDADDQDSQVEADATEPGSYSSQPTIQPAVATQQPETAAQPVENHQEPELKNEPTPQPDFSYLREVEDLRVPARDIHTEQYDEEEDQAAGAYADADDPAEDADILYEDYDDEGRGLFASRGMVVAAGVLAFVLLGGGALLAYQAIFSSDDSGPPPLVLADKSPVRMLPDGQAAETGGNGEIALTDESNAADGVMQPGAETPIARINPNIDQDRQVRQVGVEDNNSSGEGIAPRSVRTFKVNPDGSIVAEPAPVTDNSNAVQPRSVTTQPISGAGEQVPSGETSESAGVPVPRPRPGDRAETTTGSQTSVATADEGRAAFPVSPRVPDGTSRPAFNESAPALQPSENTVPTRVPTSNTAVALQEPPSQPATSTATGDFVVQVSSQRSEEAARSAYTGLQRRFPTVLGDQSPDIVRADLGSRGVFYRVRVGPMETRLAANDLCQSLKNAGGDCIVARR
uniref:SPOR domain-containing protein n=1 Tax=Pararhizobium sp. IMCC3301 TaxID=3067904 RepID=UPI002742553D|nr:SPOR domain-containing protein [Pararhizobium sp. IMCC3301]